jgi:aquaporin Z
MTKEPYMPLSAATLDATAFGDAVHHEAEALRDLAHRERQSTRLSVSRPLSQKLCVEFIGTFVLVVTVATATTKTGAGPLGPLAIGFALMAMVFAGGHISGGHYNPAVSLAVLLRGRLSRSEAFAYVLAQLLAGTAAGLLARALSGPEAGLHLASTWKVLTVEVLFTFALAYVVLNVAVAKDTAGNSFYGLAIGLTVGVGALAVGKISGGAFNFSVALGSTVTGAFALSHLWIYALANLLGGTLGAAVVWYLIPPEPASGDA